MQAGTCICWKKRSDSSGHGDIKTSHVNKDWTCKDKDKDLTHKDHDKEKDFTYIRSYLLQVAAKSTNKKPKNTEINQLHTHIDSAGHGDI